MHLIPLFKGLSDPIRLRIIHLLCQKGELCVCHLTDALVLPQSTVSRHLNTLRNCGLVVAERRGAWVYYQIKADDHVLPMMDIIKRASQDDEQLQRDLTMLQQPVC